MKNNNHRYRHLRIITNGINLFCIGVIGVYGCENNNQEILDSVRLI